MHAKLEKFCYVIKVYGIKQYKVTEIYFTKDAYYICGIMYILSEIHFKGPKEMSKYKI